MKKVRRQPNRTALITEISHEPGIPKSFILGLEMDDCFQAKPGQFITLEPLAGGTVMPRPFSVVGQHGKEIAVMIKISGPNTRLYSKLKIGSTIMVSGPKGTPISISRKEKYILVGGGIGTAGLIFLAEELRRAGKEVLILLGARTREDLHGSWVLRRFNPRTIVERSETERTGLVTDLLSPFLDRDQGRSVVVACGPKPMLAKVAQMAALHDNPCQVILEEIMACGTGSCKGCAVFGRDGMVKHACSDGPAFEAGWVDWKNLLPPKPLYRKANPNRPITLELNKPGRRPQTNPLQLDYAIMNSSGCLGIEALESGAVDPKYLGALVTKGVTVEPRTGNKGSRICETALGMINSIGLENLGLVRFRAEELPRWLGFSKPVIVNISGYAIADYIRLTEELADTAIAGLEVNISCPNIKGGGMAFGTDPELVERITANVVAMAKNKFVIVKLSPNVTDIVAIAKAAIAGGADAISLVNTFLAMDIDIVSRRPKIGMVLGGLSGPAIAPIALRMIYELRAANLGVPIIGLGGIDSPETATKFFLAGADAIAIGTATFSRPRLAEEICQGLEKAIRVNGFNSVSELTGSLVI